LRSNKMRAIGMVEIRYAFSGEFEMLALIFTYWDMCCSVDQDVCGLENGIGE